MQSRAVGSVSSLARYFCTVPVKTAPGPGEIFKRVAERDIKGALEICGDFALAVKLPKEVFLSRQCSERSYLIYRLSVDSRADALRIAESGSAFPDGVAATDLLSRGDLWDEDVQEQYQRAANSIHLSRAALELGSEFPARDHQIIGKSIVWKLLFGRSACVLQTFLSRTLQASSKPYEFAIANHRRAATLFDEQLAPPGPEGPLEKPEYSGHDPEIFKSWCAQRVSSANEHMRLIVHLTSDVARHVLPREDGKALLHAAETIMSEELDDDKEKAYAAGVFKATRRAL